MENILNTWNSTKDKKVWYQVDKPVYVNGDCRVFKQLDECYLYTFKNVAIAQLVCLSIPIVEHLVNGTTDEKRRFKMEAIRLNLKNGLSLLEETK